MSGARTHPDAVFCPTQEIVCTRLCLLLNLQLSDELTAQTQA